MSAQFRNIGDASIPLPEFIVLDASVILSTAPSIVTTSPRHEMARNFLSQRLLPAVRAGRVLAILPYIAYEECLFKVCEASIGTFARAGTPWHVFYKQSPSVIQQVLPALRALDTYLRAFPLFIPEPEDTSTLPRGSSPSLRERLLHFVEDFNVLPRDGSIIAEAERLGVNALATIDRDWLRATGFTVFAPP